MSPDALIMLADRLRALGARVGHLEHTERSEQTGSIQRSTFAALPPGFDGQVYYVIDARKVGEAPAAGTGVIGYYSSAGPAGATWYRLADDTALAV